MNNTITKPLISIIILIYNRKEVIKWGLDSIYSQGLNTEEFEVLAVNNGSTDPEVQELLESYTYQGGRPGNFRIVNVEINRRAGSGRNAGMQAAKGKYILHRDHDDAFTPQVLPKVIDCLKRNRDLDILIGDYETVEFDGKKLLVGMRNINNSTDVITGEKYLLTQNQPFLMTHAVVRREMIIKNDIFATEAVVIEDVEWIMNAIVHARKVMYQPIPILQYYKYDSGASVSAATARFPWVDGLYNMFERIYQRSFSIEDKLPDGAKAFRIYFQHNYGSYAKYLLWRLPRRDIKRIMESYPRHRVLNKDFYEFVNKHPKLYVAGATVLGPVMRRLLDAYRKFRHAEPI